MKLNPKFILIKSYDLRNSKLESMSEKMKKCAFDYVNINGDTPISIIIDEYKEKDKKPVMNLLVKGKGRPIYLATIDLTIEETNSKN